MLVRMQEFNNEKRWMCFDSLGKYINSENRTKYFKPFEESDSNDEERLKYFKPFEKSYNSKEVNLSKDDMTKN